MRRRRFIEKFERSKQDGWVSINSIGIIEICEFKEKDFNPMFYVGGKRKKSLYVDYQLSKLYQNLGDAEKCLIAILNEINECENG